MKPIKTKKPLTKIKYASGNQSPTPSMSHKHFKKGRKSLVTKISKSKPSAGLTHRPAAIPSGGESMKESLLTERAQSSSTSILKIGRKDQKSRLTQLKYYQEIRVNNEKSRKIPFRTYSIQH
mmetsp:Transcript_17543/g.19733  ORF Transcript_17543/g.19733 Transcript_17543/m.19733 type:complete len:122 (-) Transcript_17543:32-397(-)